jgi:hypothetical protein
MFEKLKDCFYEDELEFRVQSAGKNGDRIWALVVCYVTNRAIQNRLDEVVGAENWRNRFEVLPNGTILCGISIKVGDEWVTKYDGAGQTDIESEKGGLSSAMKRAAVQWGIGRYLYNLKATYADIADKGTYYQAGKDGKYPAFRWNAPRLPAWALPQGSPKKEATTPEELFESKEQIGTPKKYKGDINALKKVMGNCETISALDGIMSQIPAREWTASEIKKIDELYSDRKSTIELMGIM